MHGRCQNLKGQFAWGVLPDPVFCWYNQLPVLSVTSNGVIRVHDIICAKCCIRLNLPPSTLSLHWWRWVSWGGSERRSLDTAADMAGEWWLEIGKRTLCVEMWRHPISDKWSLVAIQSRCRCTAPCLPRVPSPPRHADELRYRRSCWAKSASQFAWNNNRFYSVSTRMWIFLPSMTDRLIVINFKRLKMSMDEFVIINFYFLYFQ